MSNKSIEIIKKNHLTSLSSNKQVQLCKQKSVRENQIQNITYGQFIEVVENTKLLQPHEIRRIYNRKKNSKLKSIYMNPPIPLLKHKPNSKKQQFLIPGFTVNGNPPSQLSCGGDQQNNGKKHDVTEIFSSRIRQTSIQRIKQIYSSRKKQYLNNIKMKFQSKPQYFDSLGGEQIKIINYSNHQLSQIVQKKRQRVYFVRTSQSAKFQSQQKISQTSKNKVFDNIFKSKVLNKQSDSEQKQVIQFSQSPKRQARTQRKIIRESQKILSYKQFKPQQKIYQKINIQSILQRKYEKDFSKYIEGYLKRLKLAQDVRIFVFDSRDVWVKKCLIQKGWHENQNKQSNAFHLKWTTKVSKNEPLFKQQILNHFRQCDKITSKSGLIKVTKNDEQLKKCIPRSYDLSFQYIQFVKDYKRTCFTSFLRKISKFIQTFRRQRDYQILNSLQLSAQFSYMINSKDIIGPSNKQMTKQLILHIPNTILLCAYLICWKNILESQEDWNKNFIQLNQQSQRKVIKFSEINPPYNDFYEYRISPRNSNAHKKSQNQNIPQVKKGSETDIQANKIQFGKTINEYAISQNFDIPSQKLISIVLSLDYYYSNKLPHYKIDGVNNYWIKKPSTSSKGVGIRLQTSLDNLLKNRQNYIVQKYIQECAILNDWSILHQRKFDMRIWVLVASFTPLEAYYYRDFYAKIAPQVYDLQKFQELKSHLTNYSQHKQSYKNKQQSVIYGKQLLQNISKIQQSPKNQNFCNLFYVQLQKLIKNVLKKYQGIINNGGSNFQLYGFDILMDRQFKLHLLQVNLSPACDERVPWLSKMLKEMTYSLIQMVTQNNEKLQKQCRSFLKQKGLWRSL